MKAPAIIMSPTESRDQRIILFLAILIMLVTLIPYLIHVLTPVPQMSYQGIERYPNDQLCYLSWLNQIRQGQWLVQNMFVTDTHQPVSTQVIWLGLGLLGRNVSVESVTLYHGARVVFGILYLCALFRLLGLFTPDRTVRWLAWVLVVGGSGWGWLMASKGGDWSIIQSADAMPELWTFTSLLYFPHFPMALWLMVGTIEHAILTVRQHHFINPVIAAIYFGLLILTHTYTALTLSYILVLFAVIEYLKAADKRAYYLRIFIFTIMCLPFAFYQAQQFFSSDLMQKWLATAQMPSPPLLSWLVGFGLITPLALIGLWNGRKSGKVDNSSYWLIILWIGVTVIFLCSNLNFERRCVEGLHIPLCLLAAVTISQCYRYLEHKVPQAIPVVYILLAVAILPGSIYALTREVSSRAGYAPAAVIQAEQDIYKKWGAQASVFCSGYYGQWFPAQGRVSVYLGHWQLSFNHDTRQALVDEFFNPQTPVSRRHAIMQQVDCDYIYADKTQMPVLSHDNNFKQVFKYQDSAVYQYVPVLQDVEQSGKNKRSRQNAGTA